MGWKQRGNRSYYYESRREGRRVVSEYRGTGEAGVLFAGIDRLMRQKRDLQWAQEKAEREEIKREEREIAAWFDGIEALATGAMLAAGFHKHHGHWRRNGPRACEEKKDDGCVQ